MLAFILPLFLCTNPTPFGCYENKAVINFIIIIIIIIGHMSRAAYDDGYNELDISKART